MYKKIIEFWFKELEPSKWWVKDLDFDAMISERFSHEHHQAANCELYDWRQTSQGALAEIIILDQFSRNMFRDTARSFAYDSQALSLSQSAIASGLDEELSIEMKSFLYMPFMHSESIIIHQEASKLFAQLGVQSTIEFEKKHKEIIEKFGRYPHRNEILGRESTREEKAFLKLAGSSF